MARLRLSDLPPDARAKVEAQLGEKQREGKTRSRTKKSAPTAGVDVVCHACGTRLTSEPAMKRHGDATGHGRYEIVLDDD